MKYLYITFLILCLCGQAWGDCYHPNNRPDNIEYGAFICPIDGTIWIKDEGHFWYNASYSERGNELLELIDMWEDEPPPTIEEKLKELEERIEKIEDLHEFDKSLVDNPVWRKHMEQ